MFAKNQVPIKKTLLLERIKKNKKDHIKKHQESMEGYKIEVQEHLDLLQVALKNTPLNELDHTKIFGKLRRPVSHEDGYNEALEILEVTEEDPVTLSHSQFENLFKDQWHWKEGFEASATLFRSKAGYDD